MELLNAIYYLFIKNSYFIPIGGETMAQKSSSFDHSLAVIKPEVSLEWHQQKNHLSLMQVSKGSDKKVWWQCKMGHEWEATISYRTNNGTGCPLCWRKGNQMGFFDI
jgi:hypothetical protein